MALSGLPQSALPFAGQPQDRPEVSRNPASFHRARTPGPQPAARGHPNREIALALGIDESTVKAHIGRLMRKVV